MLKAMGAAIDHNLTDSTRSRFLASPKVSKGRVSPPSPCGTNAEGASCSIGCSSDVDRESDGLSISKVITLSVDGDDDDDGDDDGDVAGEGEPLLSNAPPLAFSVTLSIFEFLAHVW